MERFFGFGEDYFYQYGRFETFSIEHLLMLVGCIALWILIPLSMRNRSEKAQAVFRISLACFMLFTESTWYIWYGLQHGLDVKVSLPLQLCSFALYSSVLLLFTGKQIFFELSYFLGLGGALQALITPNLEYHFLHVRWFHFTVIHFTLILVPLYFIIVQKYRITYKSLFRDDYESDSRRQLHVYQRAAGISVYDRHFCENFRTVAVLHRRNAAACVFYLYCSLLAVWRAAAGGFPARTSGCSKRFLKQRLIFFDNRKKRVDKGRVLLYNKYKV